MKPLTQSEIDATGLLDGWTVDDMYETLIDPTGFRFKGCVKTAITRLVRTCIANRLEAAPQPPVEQSVWNVGQIEQDERGHPSPVGLVEIYGSKKFCHTCRRADCSHIREVVEMGKTQGWFITFEVGKVKPVAPPAVIEPEPELDEFVLELREWQANDDKDVAILERVIGLYREMITRKGDK